MNRPSTAVLEGILSQAQVQYVQVVEKLKRGPHDEFEYENLLDREALLAYHIEQVKGQIAAARGVK